MPLTLSVQFFDVLDVLIEATRSELEGDDLLTNRQREVLQLIAEGRTRKEVARILNILNISNTNPTGSWRQNYSCARALRSTNEIDR